MPLGKQDSSHLFKSRLKSDLVDHNVEQHLRHTKAADFSSDDDDDDDDDDDEQIHHVADEDLRAAKMPDPSSLTDADLKAMLLKHGFKPGPIVASTRLLYERKLRRLLQSEGHDGAENNVKYSDSEEEREGHDEEDKKSVLEQEITEVSERQQEKHACSPTNKTPSSTRNPKNVIKSSEQTGSQRSCIPAGISKTSSTGQRSGLRSVVSSGVQSVGANGSSSFEAFSIAQMVEEMETRRSLSPSSEELNSSCVLKLRSQFDRLDLQFKDKNTLEDQSIYCTPKDSCREQGIKVRQEPVADILKDLFPNAPTSPTGIYATPRRPIKGAALRPIQYPYPDTPVSPLTQERREVERHLVPFHIQIVVFFTLMFILYLIYVNVEHSSPVLALLESLN